MKRVFVAVAILALAGACNTTSRLDIPVVEQNDLIEIEEATERQASFALSKVIANIKRGTTIGHYPAEGVEGAEGHLCNYRHQSKSTIEWGTGTSVLGNWSTELGEIFHQALSSKGLNISGSPKDLFGRGEAVASAEYLIGARITEIKSNFCEAHHWWDGRPLNEYSGEVFIDVEWTIFSTIQQREILTTSTRGYYLQVKPKRQGIILAFHEAFAIASENLLTSMEFVDIARGKVQVEVAEQSNPVRYFSAKELSSRRLENRVDRILPSVVTVRIGLGHGSGFVISEDGLVLTNQHVVGQSNRVSIILNNGVEVEGAVLAISEARDVSLIKIPLRTPLYLPVRTTRPSPPERVYVIGTPVRENLQSTVTTGVVSAIRVDPRTNLSFIQSDAAISPGNSGGPLLDENGNVIGISVQKVVGRYAEGLNLFIPIDEALEALNLKPKPSVS